MTFCSGEKIDSTLPLLQAIARNHDNDSDDDQPYPMFVLRRCPPDDMDVKSRCVAEIPAYRGAFVDPKLSKRKRNGKRLAVFGVDDVGSERNEEGAVEDDIGGELLGVDASRVVKEVIVE